MANQVAIVYVEVDTAGVSVGALKCKKAAWADIDLLQLSADERYLAIHMLHQQADTGPPNDLVINGHELISLKYTRARGVHPEKIDIKPHAVTPVVAKQHTLEGNTQANNRQILNRAIPDKIAGAAAFDMSAINYNYSNPDYNTLDSMATNYDVQNDALCELLS